jgi:hypothetical protein
MSDINTSSAIFTMTTATVGRAWDVHSPPRMAGSVFSLPRRRAQRRELSRHWRTLLCKSAMESQLMPKLNPSQGGRVHAVGADDLPAA